MMIKESFLLRTLGLALGVCLLLAARPAHAQLSFGVAAGLNYSSIGDVEIGSAQTTYDRRSGYHFGVFFDLSAGPLALRPGVYYLNAGPLFEDGINVGGFQDDFDLNFVSVPVDLRFQLPLPLLKPYVSAGPEFRFLTDTDTDDEDFRESLNDMTVAGNVGVGVLVDFPIIGLKLYPEARYAFGLSAITGEEFEIGGQTFTASEGQKVNMFMLRLGVGF